MRFATCLAAAAVALLAAAPAALAQKTQTIRLTIGSSHPPVIPWVLAMKNTVVADTNKALEAKGSKYRIEWNEAYGGVLFNFENTLEAVQQGIADMGWVGTLWEPAKMPLHNIGYAVPFANGDPDIIIKVMDELSTKHPEFAKEWDKYNLVFFSTTTSDSYELFTKFPVTKLEDIKGKKLLSAGAVGTWVEALGATFVNSGIPAMYNSLQTGVGDGSVLIPSGAIPIKLPEVAPYVTIVDLGAVPFGGFAANKTRWMSLPQEVRDTIKPIAARYSRVNVDIVKARAKAGMERLAKDGKTKISTLSPQERKRWADSMPNVAKNWVQAAEKRGIKGAKQIMKDYIAALQKAGAKPVRDWAKDL